jgi:TPR repeat protein
MYDNGKGVPQDHAEAAKWYRTAAEQGLAVRLRGRMLLQVHEKKNFIRKILIPLPHGLIKQNSFVMFYQ